MGKGVNKWIGIGNIGREPELKHSAGGSAVLKFSVACSESFKDKSGQWQEKTEWVHVTSFGKNAEIMADKLKKGAKVYIEGKIQTSTWDDAKTGEKKYRTEVVVQDWILLGGREAKQEDVPNDEGGSIPF